MPQFKFTQTRTVDQESSLIYDAASFEEAAMKHAIEGRAEPEWDWQTVAVVDGPEITKVEKIDD
jgi:hypothetical protein